MHVLHGSLMIPGWGRPIVGWVGVFMFVSCLTGIWLWWPLTGTVASGFKWKRRNTINANLHYMTGFWILFPLAMLRSPAPGSASPRSSASSSRGPRPPAAPARRRRAPVRSDSRDRHRQPLAAAAPVRDRRARQFWPTDQKAEWKIAFDRKGGPAEVVVADAGGKVCRPPPPKPETLARTMRRWHDGTGMGAAWQIIIFLGGIIPALLSVTGIIIWWRARKPRARAAACRRATA